MTSEVKNRGYWKLKRIRGVMEIKTQREQTEKRIRGSRNSIYRKLSVKKSNKEDSTRGI